MHLRTTVEQVLTTTLQMTTDTFINQHFFLYSISDARPPLLSGTRNVLSSCQKLGVKRVALTSSTGSVYVNYGTVPADHVYTSADWSPAELLREKQNWYCRSTHGANRTTTLQFDGGTKAS